MFEVIDEVDINSECKDAMDVYWKAASSVLDRRKIEKRKWISWETWELLRHERKKIEMLHDEKGI